jgi:hypothetical protein
MKGGAVMEQIKAYEHFPPSLAAGSVLVNISIYALGAYVLSGFGLFMAGLYLLFCLGQELRIMRYSCVDCYYYGKLCALGRGKVAPLLFKRGDTRRFITKTISRKELLPDMLVLIFPLIGGVVLMIQDFSWRMIALLSALVTLSLGGNYVVRSQIACKYCKQREIGCPAEKFFSKNAP